MEASTGDFSYARIAGAAAKHSLFPAWLIGAQMGKYQHIFSNCSYLMFIRVKRPALFHLCHQIVS